MTLRTFHTIIAMLGMLSLCVGAVLALRQPVHDPVAELWRPREMGAPGGNGSNGGMQQGPGQMAQFREDHKFTFQLLKLTNGTQRLERDPQTALSAEQARDLLAALQPLRNLPKLSQDKAKETIRQVQRILTIEQRTAIAQQPSRRRSGGGGGGFSRSGGQSSGERRPFDPVAMRNFNPFAHREEEASSMGRYGNADELFAFLQERASGAQASPATGRDERRRTSQTPY